MTKIKLSKAEEDRFLRMVWWMRRHPVLALYVVFGIRLSPHQRICFRSMFDVLHVILMLSRGMSKTFLDGMFICLKSILWSNATGVALTRGFRGGKLILEQSVEPAFMQRLASQEKDIGFARICLQTPSKVINRNQDLWTVKTSHGSAAQTGPLGSKQQTSPLRGIRANTYLILDESADIEQDIRDAVINPFTRVARDPIGGVESDKEGLHIINSGTVKYDFQAYSRMIVEYKKRIDEGQDDYMVIEFNYEDAFYYEGNKKENKEIFTYRINLDEIFEELKSGEVDEDTWLAENKNRIIVQKDTEFSPKLIESIRNVELEDGSVVKPLLSSVDPVVIGFDPARESADAAFVVIRCGWLCSSPVPYNDIVFIKRFYQARFETLYLYTRQLLNFFPNTLFVVMDKGGGGSWIRDRYHDLSEEERLKGILPIFDPNDEQVDVNVREKGLPILCLDAATAEANTLRVNYTKAQMQAKLLLFPYHIRRHDDKELEEAYKNCYRAGQQFTWIKSRPAGNWKNYYVDKPLKKDIFSATLLGMSKIRELRLNTEQKEEDEVENCALWA